MPLTVEELAGRLRKAREACGLKQDDVAGRMGLSRPTVSQIEKGKRSVSGLELERLARLYGRGLEELLSPGFSPEDPLSALFRAVPQAEAGEEVTNALRACLDLAREVKNLEVLLQIPLDSDGPVSYPFDSPATRRDAIRQGRRLAKEARGRLGLGDKPVVDLDSLLESEGIRTAHVDLPDTVSGVTLPVPGVGYFVVVNRKHGHERQRFSMAHEHAHVLIDRSVLGAVSFLSDPENLLEVRANVFAAEFLMPEGGVLRLLEALGKGVQSRSRVDVFDEDGATAVEVRSEPGSQDVQLYDVVQVAHHFGVSRLSALFRLKNLRLATEEQFEKLRADDEAGKGRLLEDLLGLNALNRGHERNQFRHRFVGMALEAFRRSKISRRKLFELGAMVDIPADRLDTLLEGMGLGATDDNDVLSPEGL